MMNTLLWKLSALILWSCCWVATVTAAGVLLLNDSNFAEKTAGRTVFLKFFAPWCGHCQALAPTWEKLADEFNDDKIALVAKVDCDSSDSEEVCDEFEITGFPTLYWGDPQSPEEYQGDRDFETLLSFAKEHITKPICSVRNLDHCTKEQQDLIKGLEAKGKEELEETEFKIEAQLAEAQKKFDEDMEALNERYEQIVGEFNKRADQIREETHYKWVQQILAKMEPEEEDGAKEEL